jgi:hypothetical protein
MFMFSRAGVDVGFWIRGWSRSWCRPDPTLLEPSITGLRITASGITTAKISISLSILLCSAGRARFEAVWMTLPKVLSWKISTTTTTTTATTHSTVEYYSPPETGAPSLDISALLISSHSVIPVR